ncbi:ATP-binding protein [Nocardiopsis sp. CT-R113]|uniref:ATP-binding protein n=1 Tax=Nocardiopsis codii TaxID=3065942 RepID=A0ABU7K2U9_9ACTN|nr:ATP-binding protein [Nocardiopsis sp. CT-R113]MEE2036576.1 ATP-binding protein [Nocardiopsis sp. CT-R113]
MNAELVSSELDSEPSWSRPTLAEASDDLPSWWNHPPCRLAVGQASRSGEGAARAFGSVPGSVRRAREFVASVLGEWAAEDVSEDVRLIVSEFVGNSCRHAVPREGDPESVPVVVELRRLGERGGVLCMVTDSSGKAPVKVDAHHFAESGRGLGLVAAFSSEWGWNPLVGGGKVVWAVCGGEA